jgi:hypothetical protein
MRIALLLICLACIVGSGCTLVPTDMFPKVRWYWSQDAKDYRAEKTRTERNYEASTNQFTNPK